MSGGLLRRTVLRVGRIAGFVGYFGWEFLVSNVIVLREVLSPRRRSSPAILEVPLRSRSRIEIVSVANLVALTPGTLAVEVVLEPPTLFIHGMFAADVEEFRREITDLERRMLGAFRPVASWPEQPEVVGR